MQSNEINLRGSKEEDHEACAIGRNQSTKLGQSKKHANGRRDHNKLFCIM